MVAELFFGLVATLFELLSDLVLLLMEASHPFIFFAMLPTLLICYSFFDILVFHSKYHRGTYILVLICILQNLPLYVFAAFFVQKSEKILLDDSFKMTLCGFSFGECLFGYCLLFFFGIYSYVILWTTRRPPTKHEKVIFTSNAVITVINFAFFLIFLASAWR